MKKTLLVLSLAACLSVSAFAGESFSVDGQKGAALFSALTSAGAQPKVQVDTVTFTVNSVSCTQGFAPGHGPFANCTFSEQLPVLRHATQFQNFEVNGDKAVALINALEDAGVKGAHSVEMTEYSAQNIECFSLAFGGNGVLGKSCQISLAE